MFAFSGEEAIETLKDMEQEAVLILSDINMPGMSGLQLLEIIKKGIVFSKFGIIPAYILTSARRYKCNGVFYLQYHFALLHYKYKKGTKTEQLKSYYLKHIS